MKTSVLIPFRSNEEHRLAAFEQVQKEALGWGATEVLSGGSGRGEFNRAQARNNLASNACGEILVFLDADSLVSKAQIRDICWLLGTAAKDWGFPYTKYCSWNKAHDGYDYVFPSEANPEPSVGGCVVIRRSAFEDIGGYDERFVGWGEEDRAFALAAQTLWGDPYRATGDIFHLWHPAPETERFENPYFQTNRALCNRYREAAALGVTMRALVSEPGRGMISSRSI